MKPKPMKSQYARLRAVERADAIITDLVTNHLPRVEEGLRAGYVDENQILAIYDHAVRARILRETAEAEPVQHNGASSKSRGSSSLSRSRILGNRDGEARESTSSGCDKSTDTVSKEPGSSPSPLQPDTNDWGKDYDLTAFLHGDKTTIEELREANDNLFKIARKYCLENKKLRHKPATALGITGAQLEWQECVRDNLEDLKWSTEAVTTTLHGAWPGLLYIVESNGRRIGSLNEHEARAAVKKHNAAIEEAARRCRITCDQCSRKLEDGALYEDHTARDSRWVGVKDRLPEPCEPVIGFKATWIHSDYNKTGVRECFMMDNGQWITARWNNTHDTYENQESNPTHWRRIIPPENRNMNHER